MLRKIAQAIALVALSVALAYASLWTIVLLIAVQ